MDFDQEISMPSSFSDISSIENLHLNSVEKEKCQGLRRLWLLWRPFLVANIYGMFTLYSVTNLNFSASEQKIRRIHNPFLVEVRTDKSNSKLFICT